MYNKEVISTSAWLESLGCETIKGKGLKKKNKKLRKMYTSVLKEVIGDEEWDAFQGSIKEDERDAKRGMAGKATAPPTPGGLCHLTLILTLALT